MRGEPDGVDHPRRTAFPVREFLWCAGVLVLAVAVELLVAWFVKSKGVAETGDEPSYIIQAQAYLHLSPLVLSTIRSDLAAHALSAFAPGTPVTSVESFTGPHGMIGPFEPGLGILLMPFVAFGHIFLGATVGMLVIETAGLILIHRRATRLAGLGPRGQVLLGLVLAGPAVVMAMNQIYPDLVSGVFLACAIVEVALVERTSVVTRTNTLVVVVAVALLPWLQVKNVVPAVIVLLAYVVAARRTGAGWGRVAVASGAAVVAWILLFLYNHIYFGHLGGLPEPMPRVSVSGVEYTLGLLFDRHQGMFVQVPFALLGLVGLWVARRRLPAAVVATVLSVVAVLVLNGTYTGNPYGGLTLAGRFMWTLLPVMILWIAIVIGRWQEAGRLLWTPILVVVAAWIYQAVPVVNGTHVYYNAFTVPTPWDPATWPGWWPGLERVLPQFDLPGHALGAPAWGLLVELALAAVLVIAACMYMRPGPFPRWSLATMGVLVVLAAVAWVVAEPLVPTTTLSYDAAQLGAPVTGGPAGQTSPQVALQGVPPGTYRLTLAYLLTGGTPSGTMAISCNAAGGAATAVTHTALPPGRPTATVTLRCTQAGTIDSELTAGAGTRLDVASLRLERAGP